MINHRKKLEQQGACECGSTTFAISGTPLVRTICHCTVCQEFNAAAYGDVTIFLKRDVHLANESTVNFKKYMSPSAVRRGKCVACAQPAIEFFEAPLMPSLAIVPSENIQPGQFLPEATSHIFCHSRVAEITDTIPQYSGYFGSQMGLFRKLITGFLSRRRKD